MLVLDHVGKTYPNGVRAVHDVSLEVEPGEIAVIIGASGSGKSTLLRLVCGLDRPTQGALGLDGATITGPHEKIGVVFQEPRLLPWLRVADNVGFGLARRRPAERKQRVAAALDRVGLAEQRRDKARRLSGGQRRRVEIARALLHQPRLLLLDEPTVGLDIASRQFMLDHVRRLCREEGLAALWATHLIDEVGEGARVVVLHKGEVLADGAAAQLIGQMRAPSMRVAFETLVQEREAA